MNFKIVYAAPSEADFRRLLAEFGESVCQVSPAVARQNLSAPAPQNGGIGENEKALAEFLGIENRRPTISGKMVEMFGLTGSREDQSQKLLGMLQNGDAVKTAQGYQLGNGMAGQSKGQESATTAEKIDIDAEEGV